MNMARMLERVARVHQREQRRLYMAKVYAGDVKGPLVLLHESGRKHPWRKCPVCVTEYIRATNS